MSTEDDFSAFRRIAGEEMAKLGEENAKLRAHAERVGAANDRLVVENADLHATLDTIISADERAVKLWRAAHPGNELVIPDRGRLVGWLLEQNDALRADKARLDWLETQDCWIGVYGDYEISSRISAGGGYSQTIRASVDAARKEAQQ